MGHKSAPATPAVEVVEVVVIAEPIDDGLDGDLWGSRVAAAEDVYDLRLDACWVAAALDHGIQPGFEDLFGDRDARCWGPVLQAAY